MRHEHHPTLSLAEAASVALPPAGRLRTLALALAIGGLAATILGGFMNPAYFFRGWLVAGVFAMNIALGCLALTMLQHLTHGGWGLIQRRTMESAALTIPVLMAVFLLPIIVLGGLPHLYEWARPEVVKEDHLLQLKEPYLNVPFFLLRQVIYLAVWGGLALLFARMSRRQDAADEGSTRRMQAFAGPGLILYALALTFASTDWLMSLQPHWFSTIYGVYLMGSQGMSAIAFLIVFGVWLSRRQPMDRVIHPRHFHDYGKLLLAFAMLWAYFSYSQFLIIWSGNLPEENSFYLARLHHGWGPVSLAIALFHFAVPFAILLSRGIKRRGRTLIRVAWLLLFMRWVELVWQVEPAFHEHNYAMLWMYLAATLAMAGIGLLTFLWLAARRPLLPANDPYLPEALAYE